MQVPHNRLWGRICRQGQWGLRFGLSTSETAVEARDAYICTTHLEVSLPTEGSYCEEEVLLVDTFPEESWCDAWGPSVQAAPRAGGEEPEHPRFLVPI